MACANCARRDQMGDDLGAGERRHPIGDGCGHVGLRPCRTLSASALTRAWRFLGAHCWTWSAALPTRRNSHDRRDRPSAAKFARVRAPRAAGVAPNGSPTTSATPAWSWWSPMRTSLLYETGHIPGAVEDRLAHRPERPGRRATTSTARVSPKLLGGKGIARDRHGRHLRRQEQLVGRSTRSGCSPSSATRMCASSTAGETSGSAEGREYTTDVPSPAAVDYPVVAARGRGVIRAYKDEVLAHLGNAAGRRPHPEEYNGERTAHARLPRGGRCAPGTSSTARERPVGAGCSRRRHLQVARDELDAIYRGEAGLKDGDHDHRVLPHRRALEPHLVRAHAPPRLPERPQLRRLVDRVGQRRARADPQAARDRSAENRTQPRAMGMSVAGRTRSPRSGTNSSHSSSATASSCCWSSRTSCPSCRSATGSPRPARSVEECRSGRLHLRRAR